MSEKEPEKLYPYFRASRTEAEGAWAEKRRLADAMRKVIDRMVRADASAESLAKVADRLESFAAELEAFPQRSMLEGFAESSLSGDVTALFDMSPIIGRSNPIAPPVHCEVVDGEVVGRVTFSSAYEGPPGHVHGGVVAAVFDEVLGFVQSLTANAGMTGTLEIKYRAPTPLHRPLTVKGRVEKTEGRKTIATGQIFDGDTLCAESTGLFVSIDPERFRKLVAKKRHDEDSSKDRGGS